MVQTTTTIQCYSCECEVLDADKVIHNNQIYCQVCFDDEYTMCTSCESTIDKDNVFIASDSEYCGDCWHDKFFECNSCNGTFNKDYREYDNNSNDICQDCYNEYYTSCNECLETISRDDATYNDDGDSYCSSCWDEQENDCLKFEYSKTFERNVSKRYVGIELEYIQIHTPDLTDYGLIKDDGSVSAKDDSEGQGQEFVSFPRNGDLLLDTIDSVSNNFKSSKAYINSTCGFHVHLDMRNSTLTERGNVYNAWRVFEPIFFDMTSQSRRDNTYCKPMRLLTTLQAARNADRYRSLNVTAYSKYQTFEVRLHQGTIDKVKVKNWVTLLLSFFDTFQYIKFNANELWLKTDREKLIYLFQQCKIPLTLRKYMVNRILKFKNQSTGQYWIKPIKDSWSNHEQALFLQESERV